MCVCVCVRLRVNAGCYAIDETEGLSDHMISGQTAGRCSKCWIRIIERRGWIDIIYVRASERSCTLSRILRISIQPIKNELRTCLPHSRVISCQFSRNTRHMIHQKQRASQLNNASMSQVAKFNAQSRSVEVIIYVTLKTEKYEIYKFAWWSLKRKESIRPFRSKRITSRKINSYYTWRRWQLAWR